jgi:phage/plasmid-associated DNA primase
MNNQQEQTRTFGSGRVGEYVDDDDMELSERMIQMITQHRYLREAFWLDIGKALYISDNGGENGLLSWIRHTERALTGITNIPEYMRVAETPAETCRNLYYTFANSTINVQTLAWYAREDSPDRYANWHRDWCMSSMEQALSGLHTDVAVALYRVYWLDFLYCPIGKGKWFQFKNHRWYETYQGIDLRKAISRDFVRRFESTRMILSRQIHESKDEAFRANGEITMKKITALISKLKTVGFKSSVMSEACEHFKDDKFINLLDSNPEITGVTNGVLEVSGQHVIFRTAKPQDYVSMCTNIPYHANYTWQHPLVQECMKWFGQIFTDRSLLHHFLKFSASCLKGRNSDKIFPIFTGEGDNSKSMIVKLFESTFNSYCIKFDISNVTGRSMNANGPTPQLARAKATRLAFMDEPEDDVPMHKGIIKKWVGGDSFFGRLLQDNGGDIQVTFKLILTCNKVPIIPNADKAIKNRTRLFPFQSTWVKDAPEDEAEQYRQRRFKMNVNFERRIPILAPAFLWIMSQYYPHYSNEGLADPAIVTETTEAYWRDNDVYAQFAADTIQEVYTGHGDRDKGARVTLSEIYSEFKVWFKDAFPGATVPTRPIVRSELSSRWGRMDGNAWHGIRIITTDGPIDMSAALGGRKQGSTNARTIPNAPTIMGAPATIKQHNKVELTIDPRQTSPMKPLTSMMGFIPLSNVKPISPSKNTTPGRNIPDFTKPLTPKAPTMGFIPLSNVKPVSPSKNTTPGKNIPDFMKPLTPKALTGFIPLSNVKPFTQILPLTPAQRILGLPPGTIAI